jgi:hypothetical protein
MVAPRALPPVVSTQVLTVVVSPVGLVLAMCLARQLWHAKVEVHPVDALAFEPLIWSKGLPTSWGCHVAKQADQIDIREQFHYLTAGA